MEFMVDQRYPFRMELIHGISNPADSGTEVLSRPFLHFCRLRLPFRAGPHVLAETLLDITAKEKSDKKTLNEC